MREPGLSVSLVPAVAQQNAAVGAPAPAGNGAVAKVSVTSALLRQNDFGLPCGQRFAPRSDRDVPEAGPRTPRGSEVGRRPLSPVGDRTLCGIWLRASTSAPNQAWAMKSVGAA